MTIVKDFFAVNDNTPAPEMHREFPAGVTGIYQVNLFFMRKLGAIFMSWRRMTEAVLEKHPIL